MTIAPAAGYLKACRHALKDKGHSIGVTFYY